MVLDDNVASTEAPAETTSPDYAPPVRPIGVGEDPMDSVRAAARRLAQRRTEKRQEAATSAPEPVAAEPEPITESATEEVADAAPVEIQPSSETKAPEPAELPPIEAPLSWSRADKETFYALPRETQERVAERERARDVEFRRYQNQSAETQRALESQMKAAEEMRQQYETALPMVLQIAQANYDAEFSDVRSMEDVRRLSREDPLRYTAWDARQKELSALQQEHKASEERANNERAQNWNTFAQREDQRFAEKVPELADPEKAKVLRDSAVRTLKDVWGFSDEEIAQNWNGPWRDHRVQLMLLDAVKHRQAQEAKERVKAKPIPPVTQRPGAAQPKGSQFSTEIKALEQKHSLSMKEAAELRRLRKASA
jgi:hypothetical protein